MERVTLIGAQRLTGHSDKTGKDYDFAQIVLLAPSASKGNRKSAGFYAKEVTLDASFYDQLEKMTYPTEVDIEMTGGPLTGGFRIASIKQVSK